MVLKQDERAERLSSSSFSPWCSYCRALQSRYVSGVIALGRVSAFGDCNHIALGQAIDCLFQFDIANPKLLKSGIKVRAKISEDGIARGDDSPKPWA